LIAFDKQILKQKDFGLNSFEIKTKFQKRLYKFCRK